MNILILGGDGYLGWPCAMSLSQAGHRIAVADNYLRRNLSRQVDAAPLFELPDLVERCRLWCQISGNNIAPFIGDLSDWDVISAVFAAFRPDAVVHFAEQPSAPYSMLNREAASLTLRNNITVTANVIFAVHEFAPEAHIVKLGTMGEYGTPNIDIEEGWLDIEHNGRGDRFLFPRQGGSLYHTTKIMDTDLLWFYVRTWNLRVTDLMQGPVYGIYTDEGRLDARLLPFFSYDELFGTVLNRFIVQAVADHPLTVYGRGGQRRGFLNLIDAVACIRLSLENPAQSGELRVFNQFVEIFSVNELAERVQSAGATAGLDVKVKRFENPRMELEEHYYNPAHTALLELGLRPHPLSEDVLLEMIEKVRAHKGSIDQTRIDRLRKWA